MEHVAELTRRQEARFENPWSIEDAPAEYVNALAKAIVGVEISIERLEGKWKLSQNRPPADQAAVIQGLEDCLASQPGNGRTYEGRPASIQVKH